MEYEALSEVLRAAGWDVTVYDTAVGVLDPAPGPGVWTIAVDHGGQVLFRAMRPAGVPRGERFEHGGRSYRLLREETHTLTVTTDIDAPEELPQVLEELSRLAQERAEGEGGPPAR